jgi:hypothetical protein
MAAYDLITRAEYKTYKEISSTSLDAKIDQLIPRVSELVKSTCRRRFNEWVDDTKIEVFSGDYPGLLLAETPVIAISAVEYSADYGQTYTALTEYADWVLDGDQVLCLTTERWPKRIRGYRVTYTAGYEALPGDLKLATMDIVDYYMRNDAAVHTHLMPNPNTAQIQYITSTTFPANIKRVLDLYTVDYS